MQARISYDIIISLFYNNLLNRGVAQPGSALAWGAYYQSI
jgi:hypothetical protein